MKSSAPARNRPARPHASAASKGTIAKKPSSWAPVRTLKKGGLACEYVSRDYIGAVTVTSSSVQGDIVLSYTLSPLLNTGTRLYTEAVQWERYKVKKWSFLFETTQSKFDTGQVLAFVDPDPHDVWTNDPTNMERGMAQGRSRPANIWQNFVVELPLAPAGEFYTNPANTSDTRFSTCGVLRVVNAGGFKLGSDSSRVIYNVYQHVELEFIQPELTISAALSIAEVVNQTPQFSNLFHGANISFAGIPVSVTDGKINIDTGSIGSNNIFLEVSTIVRNTADVAGSVAATLGISPGDILDIATTAARAAVTGPGQTGGESSTVLSALLSGELSWSFSAFLSGIATALPVLVITKIFTVPASISSVQRARKHLKLGNVYTSTSADIGSSALLSIRAKELVSVSIPDSGASPGALSLIVANKSASNPKWEKIDRGFSPYIDEMPGSQRLTMNWLSTGAGEEVLFSWGFEMDCEDVPDLESEMRERWGDMSGNDGGAIRFPGSDVLYSVGRYPVQRMEGLTDALGVGPTTLTYPTSNAYWTQWYVNTNATSRILSVTAFVRLRVTASAGSQCVVDIMDPSIAVGFPNIKVAPWMKVCVTPAVYGEVDGEEPLSFPLKTVIRSFPSSVEGVSDLKVKEVAKIMSNFGKTESPALPRTPSSGGRVIARSIASKD